MLDFKKGKTIITLLLALSCVISGIILAASPARVSLKLQNVQQIDSLLNLQLQSAQINPSQIQITSVSVDTILLRKNYWVKVPSRFTKTYFHIQLHDTFNPYGIHTPAKVHFPSKDMDIYVYYNDAVLRKIRLTTDRDLDTLKVIEEN